jgi:hypothetical protein
MCNFSFILSRKSEGNSSGARDIGILERKINKQLARELRVNEIWDVCIRSPRPVVK